MPSLVDSVPPPGYFVDEAFVKELEAEGQQCLTREIGKGLEDVASECSAGGGMTTFTLADEGRLIAFLDEQRLWYGTMLLVPWAVMRAMEQRADGKTNMNFWIAPHPARYREGASILMFRSVPVVPCDFGVDRDFVRVVRNSRYGEVRTIRVP